MGYFTNNPYIKKRDKKYCKSQLKKYKNEIFLREDKQIKYFYVFKKIKLF